MKRIFLVALASCCLPDASLIFGPKTGGPRPQRQPCARRSARARLRGSRKAGGRRWAARRGSSGAPLRARGYAAPLRAGQTSRASAFSAGWNRRCTHRIAATRPYERCLTTTLPRPARRRDQFPRSKSSTMPARVRSINSREINSAVMGAVATSFALSLFAAVA